MRLFQILLMLSLHSIAWSQTTSSKKPEGYENPNARRCNQFCEQFASEQSGTPSHVLKSAVVEGQSVPSQFSSTWDQSSDTLCSELGVMHNPARNTPTPDPSYNSSGGCGLNITASLLDTFNKNSEAFGISAYQDKKTCDDKKSTDQACSENNQRKINQEYNQQVCDAGMRIYQRCKYHRSQVESYCLAFLATSDSQDNSAVKSLLALITMEGIAGMTCTAACVTAEPITKKTCDVLGFTVGLSELIMTFSLQENAVAKAIEHNKSLEGLFTANSIVAPFTFLGGTAAGGIAGYAGYEKYSEWKKNKSNLQDPKDSYKPDNDSYNKQAQALGEEERKLIREKEKLAYEREHNPLQNFDDEEKVLQEKVLQEKEEEINARKEKLQAEKQGIDEQLEQNTMKEEEYKAKKADQKKKLDKAERALACVNAALFAAMLGIRSANLSEMLKTRDSACANIQALASYDPTLDPSKNPYGQKLRTPQTSPSTSSTTTQPSTGVTTSPGSSFSVQQSINFNNAMACLQSSPTSDGIACLRRYGFTYQGTGAARDGGLFNLNQIDLGPFASAIGPFPQFAEQAARDGGHLALRSVLPDFPNSDASVIEGILQFSQTAQSNASEWASLFGLTPLHSSSKSSQSSLNQSTQESLSSNSLSQALSPTDPATRSLATSLPTHPMNDIWHSHTDLLIFQIVSQKIQTHDPH